MLCQYKAKDAAREGRGLKAWDTLKRAPTQTGMGWGTIYRAPTRVEPATWIFGCRFGLGSW